MATTYLKKAIKDATTGEDDTREIVSKMLKEIEEGGEQRCEEYAKQLDGYEGNIVVSQEEIEAAGKRLSQQVKDDIKFSYDRVYGFAVKQRESLIDFETELSPGLWFMGRSASNSYASGRLLYSWRTLCACCFCNHVGWYS